MQRAIHPRDQADAIKAYLATLGVKAPHTQVLELVAKLNGAASYNVLVAQQGKGRDTSFLKTVKGWLGNALPALTAEIQAFRPAKAAIAAAQASAIFQVAAAAASSSDDDSQAYLRTAEALNELQAQAARYSSLAYKAAGFNREVAVPADGILLSVESALHLEDSQFSVEIEGERIELDAQESAHSVLLDKLRESSVVVEAVVYYPRGDRYGVPGEATEEGARELLWADGWALAHGFETYGEDTGDDSVARIEMGVYVTPEVFKQLQALTT